METFFKKRVALIGAGALIIAPMWAIPAQATPEGDNVVINEVYTRGGSNNQPFTHKFIELYNPTDEAISLDGMSLQYFAKGSGNSSGTRVDLSGESVEPEGYFLVQGNNNSDNGGPLPDPDLVSGFSPSGTDGAVALVDGTAQVTDVPAGDVSNNDNFVDFVGFGTAQRFESAAATYTGDNKVPGSITRTDGVDTDDNAADFAFISVPTPTNSEGETGGGEEPGPDPDPEALTIAEIQGTDSSTPYNGQQVTTTGVVTGVYESGGFDGAYIQTPGTGGEIGEASHGIFVYSSAMAGAVEFGDYVEVTGQAGEYFNLTQISDATYTILDDVVEEPVPAVVTPADLETDMQREVLEGMLVDVSGIDFTVTDTYQTNAHGDVALAMAGAPLPTSTDIYNPVTEEAEHDALAAENYSKMLTLGDGSSFNYTNFNYDDHETPVPYLNLDVPVRVGAVADITEPVILDYRYQWNLQPTERITGENDDFVLFEETRSAITEAPDVGGDITISTFNVLNYFISLGEDEAGCDAYVDREGNPISADYCDVRGAYTPESLERQEGKIVTAIQELDASIVGLEEIENSAKFGLDRDAAVEALVEALNEDAGSETWAYAESPEQLPENEDFIRLAFIYQVDEVTPTAEGKILIGDSAYGNAREPLGQSWQALDEAGEVAGDEFVTITNHFKSKGSGTDDGTGQGNANPDRKAQAEGLVDFVADEYADMAVFLVGDFNAYSAEDPLRILEDEGYTNLLLEQSETDGQHYFSYTFDKRVGSLDHIFADEEAHEWVVETAVWNINSVEAVAMEYSRYNYNVTNLFEPNNPFRSSDHDPIKVGLDIPGFESEDPVVTVTPEEPGFADNTITIPVVEGVEYLIDSETVTGDVAISEDTTVTARAMEGYEFSEGAVSEWNFEYETSAVPERGNLFFIANDWDSTTAERVIAFGRIGDEVYAGDFDGDGNDTLAVRRGTTFFVHNTLESGDAETEFAYGRFGDEVVVGDWDGNGTDTFGVRRSNTFYLHNELVGGNAETEFDYGRSSDEVLVGDWDGNETDTIMVRRGVTYYANNELMGGYADTEFVYGRVTDEAYAGDFDGDGKDTLAVRRGNIFHVNNQLVGGHADTSIAYGRAGDHVIIGDWDGNGTDTPTVNRIVR